MTCVAYVNEEPHSCKYAIRHVLNKKIYSYNMYVIIYVRFLRNNVGNVTYYRHIEQSKYDVIKTLKICLQVGTIENQLSKYKECN